LGGFLTLNRPTNPKVIIDKLLVEGIIIIDYSPRVVPSAEAGGPKLPAITAPGSANVTPRIIF